MNTLVPAVHLQSHSRVDRPVVLAVLFYTGLSSAGMLIAKPLIVGALIDDFGLSVREAGVIAGAEIVGVGLAPLLMTAAGVSWDKRRVVIAGLLISLVACIGPVLWSTFETVLAFRALAGVGAGLIASVVLSSLASTRDPDRTFSVYYMVSQIGGAALFPALAFVIARLGAPGAYASLAALFLPVFFLLHHIPRSWYRSTGAFRERPSARAQRLRLGGAAATLGGSMVFYIGYGAVWAFVERIGVGIAIRPSSIALALALTQGSAIMGALTASAVHLRLGRTKPIVLALALSVLALVQLWHAQDLFGYAAGAMLFSFSWMFFFPYLTGIMADQDSAGRVVVLGITAQTAGMAVGPTVAGLLAASGEYSNVLLLGIVCTVAALTLIAPMARRFEALQSRVRAPT